MLALLSERGMSLRAVARATHYDVGHLSKVSHDLRRPSPEMAERLDHVLEADGRLVALVDRKPPTLGSAERALSEVLDLVGWLESSNVGPGMLDYFATATERLAFDYPRRPPRDVLADAAELHGRVTTLLRGGRQRLAHTRMLLTTSAELLALITLLAGDVGHFAAADAFGQAGWTCADEADSDAARALVLCAQSKNARQEGRHARALEYARHGRAVAPLGPERILLAACEAIAARSLGDRDGALAALHDAQKTRDALGAYTEPSTAWTCPRPRQAVYALQIAASDAEMLRLVQEADQYWSEGDPWVYGTWAQVRISAALAHVRRGDVDGAAEELREVLALGDEYRVTSITMRLGAVAHRLRDARWSGHPVAANLRESIRAFQSASLAPNRLEIMP